jgi:hypothetical protein
MFLANELETSSLTNDMSINHLDGFVFRQEDATS